MNLFDLLDKNSRNYNMVGSKAIDPTGKNNDIDYVVLVNNIRDMVSVLNTNGYIQTSNYVGNHFVTFRKGEYNLIVTENETFYDCFVLATRLSIAAGCKTKRERIIIHNMVMKPQGFRITQSMQKSS